MSEAKREEFYQRLDDAPFAAREFFETIETRFQNRNTAFVHFTRTKGGDMRVAVPKDLTTTGKYRNFATLRWEADKSTVMSRVFLTPEELERLGFLGAKKTHSDEPLKAEVHLEEDYWRNKAEEFGRYLEAAHIKMVAYYDQSGV